MGSHQRGTGGAEEDGERLRLGGAPASAVAARELGTPWLKRTSAGGGRQAPEGGRSGGRPGSDVTAQLRGSAMDELEQSSGPASGAATKHGKKVRRAGAMRRGRRERASIAHRGNKGTGAELGGAQLQFGHPGDGVWWRNATTGKEAMARGALARNGEGNLRGGK
jgi:hypothetical protein